ncbi:unnamed protein product [Rhizophagus irregularis]|nr:unnamed protein product [Rhizophagus irregularis]
MYEFPNVSTTERVNQIFKELEVSDESTIKDWIAFYSKPWVRTSLNPIYSFIALDIWQNAPDNTNVAESCKFQIILKLYLFMKNILQIIQ